MRFTTLFLFLLPVYTNAQLPPGAIASYLFNGNADDGVGTSHGTVWNAELTTDRDGNSNAAYYFDGANDFIDIPVSNFATGDFTISFWFQSIKDGRQDLFTIGDFFDSDNVSFIVSDGSFSIQAFWNGGGGNTITEPGDLNDGAWHNIILSRSGATVTLYGDNVNFGTATFAPTVGGGLDMLLGGAFQGTTFAANWFHGKMDDVVLWSRELSAAERLQVINGFVPVVETTIAVTSPALTAHRAGGAITINWDNTPGITNVMIEISTNNGAVWTTIVASTPNNNTFSTLLPHVSSTQSLIRVTDVNTLTQSLSDWFAINKYDFTLVSSSLPQLERDGAGALVFNDKMWTIGGWDPTNNPSPFTDSKVYNSTDGVTWTQQVDGTWPGRHEAGYVVFQGKMWIIGDDDNDGIIDNSTYSSTDGNVWTQEATGIAALNRIVHNTMVLGNKIFVMGGQSANLASATEFNDVYSSTDGITWTLELASAPWAARGTQDNVAVIGGEMYVIAGGKIPNETAFNDVWKTADGVTWTEVTRHAPFLPRRYHTVLFFDNKLWLIHGTNGTNQKDIWYSVDGVTWFEMLDNPTISGHALSAFNYRGKLYFGLGGATGTTHKSFWKIQTDCGC